MFFAKFSACFSITFLFISGFVLAYISVVVIELCPKKSLIYIKLTPLYNKCIALECLNVCGETFI